MHFEEFFGKQSVVWIVAPHADDEALGCGGLIAAARERGAKVYALFMTLSGYTPLSSGSVSTHDERREELRAAMDRAGVSGYEVLFDNGKHHCRLDTVPIQEMLDWLESGSRYSMMRLHPQVILVPSALHSHQDHRRVNETMLSLLRVNPLHNGTDRLVMEYEIPGTGLPGVSAFEPTFYLALSAGQLEFKCAHFATYGSQVAPPPHVRSPYAIQALAMKRGIESGHEYAEAYRVLHCSVGVHGSGSKEE